MIERKISRFGVFFLIFMLPLCVWAQKGEKIQTIVIDAGHGGKDTGALGKVTTEKALNLAVALKFGAYIEENLPDVKVIYTRKTDKFIELSERANIANRNNADVFVSIHCNSTETPNSASGAETFVMGESKNEKNLAVAKKENAAILLEDNTDAYDNFDPNSTEAYIIFSLTPRLGRQGAEPVWQKSGSPRPRCATSRFPGALEDGHAEHPRGVGLHQQQQGRAIPQFRERPDPNGACALPCIRRV